MNDQKIFNALGFKWDRSAVQIAPVYTPRRAVFRFQQMLAEFVWDASALENNPFTYPEVKTLLDGITVGGKKISDQEQVLNLADSSKKLLSLVKSGKFLFDKKTFTDIHALVAKNEALEWGFFRGEGEEHSYTPKVSLGKQGYYQPPLTLPGAPLLNDTFCGGLVALSNCPPFERALAFFLFGALQQFFFDGNKRTARMMMNGILMSNGIDAISIPASSAHSFNEKMVRFYLTKDASEMMAFLIECHPESNLIQTLNTKQTSCIQEGEQLNCKP